VLALYARLIAVGAMAVNTDAAWERESGFKFRVDRKVIADEA
jgi:hypothetical protein